MKFVILMEFGLIVVMKFLVIIFTCCFCNVILVKLINSKYSVNPRTNSEMGILLVSGLFKGVISFALILMLEETRPKQEANVKTAKALIYGMVLFTNIIWGGILPYFLKPLVEKSNKDWVALEG